MKAPQSSNSATVSHKSLLVFLSELNVEKLPHTRTVLRGHNMEGPYEDKI